MNREQGIVIEVIQDRARIKVSRHSDCENCGSCPGDSAMVITAENPIHAQPGDSVYFQIQEQNMLKAAFIVYALPILLAFGGAFLAGYAANALKFPAGTLQIIGGILGFIGAVVLIKKYDKSAQENMLPLVVSKV